MTRFPLLSVIVPVYNSSGSLSRCLRALQSSNYRNFELLVVDDCSSEDVRKIIECSGARYFRPDSRLRPAGARNLGAMHAQGEILVFVDAVVMVSNETLQTIVEDFQKNPSISALFGSYDDAPAEGNFFSQYKNLLHHYVHQTSNSRAVTFWTGCGAVRAEIFRELHGFDARMSSIEDIEFGLRLTQSGHSILLDKNLHVKHLKYWNLHGIIKSDVCDRAAPWAQLILEKGEMPRDLNLNYRARISGAAILPLAGLGGVVPISAYLGKNLLMWIILGCLSGVLLLLALNQDIYRFFWKKRGAGFALAIIPVHWLYYLYSGLVWIYCCGRHYLKMAVNLPSPRENYFPSRRFPVQRRPKRLVN